MQTQAAQVIGDLSRGQLVRLFSEQWSEMLADVFVGKRALDEEKQQQDVEERLNARIGKTQRRRALIVYLWLQAGWNELSAAERAEVGKLLTKSRGRPRNLSKAEAKRLGALAGRAASAAARLKRR